MQSEILKKTLFTSVHSHEEVEGLADTLQIIKEETEGQKITIGEITEALNHRGFGPMLLIPVVLTILPTGAIPGVPVLCSCLIVLTSGQIICGRHYPWLPKWVKNFSFERKKFLSAMNKTKPIVTVIDHYVSPRLDFFSNDIMQRIIACFCLVLALMIAVVGFVPFMPALISIPILFFALGLSSKDGIMTLAGFMLTITVTILIFYLAGFGGSEDKIHIKTPAFISRPNFVIDLDSIHH